MAIDLELVATGDELVRGAIADTNSAWLADRLLPLGVRVRRVTMVGDSSADIRAALGEAAARAELVVVSGGLGPTTDDLTAECAAAVAGVPLVLHQPTLERIRERWARRARPMPPSVERQAMVPAGAEVLANDEGTAPGFLCAIGRARCFFFAGVPAEFRQLAERHLLPRVRAASNRVVSVRTLRCVGIPESELEAKVVGLARDAGVVLGLRARYPETWATFTLEAPSDQAAAAVLDPLVRLAVAAVEPRCYGTGDESLARVTGDLCLKAGWTLAVAESCTGGTLGAEITTVDGSSRYFRGGAITYANEEKTRALGVPEELLARHGAVSEPVVRSMAEGAAARLGASAALAVTGIAGPTGGTPEKPIGTVWIALASPAGTRSELHRFTNRDRDWIRRGSVAAALDLLRRVIRETTG